MELTFLSSLGLVNPAVTPAFNHGDRCSHERAAQLAASSRSRQCALKNVQKHEFMGTAVPARLALQTQKVPMMKGLIFAEQGSEKKETCSACTHGCNGQQNSVANPIQNYLECEDSEALHEECGVVGIYGDLDASNLAYLGLHALQHRGQEGAGIVTADGKSLRSHLGLGLVSEVFNQDVISRLKGTAAIGHVRYSTAGEKTVRNVQPFVVRYRDGQVAICHNGNLTNARGIRRELELRGSIFNTSSDTETVLHLLATSIQNTFEKRVIDALLRVEGAYCLLFLTENKLVAVRDPYGFRPLVIGKKGNTIIFASESCALDLLGATFVREVDPGEMVIVSEEGMQSSFPFPRVGRKACVFEHIYFSRPNSVVFGRSVYQTRFRFGQVLSKVCPVAADAVIPIPDSGIAAALGYSHAAGIPFQNGLIRSHYVGRTFIQPTQSSRDWGVKLKLSTVRSIIEGRSIVVVDDSLVRGTTSKKIVNLLRESGAREVHMRICSPPMVGSCYFGVDTPNREELIAYSMDVDEIRDFIGADSLAYLPLDEMRDELADEASEYCDACFSAQYPISIAEEEAFASSLNALQPARA